MMGVLLATAAGLGLGLFQTVNRRAVLGLDVFMATFIQLLVSAVVLITISLLTVNLAVLQTTSLTTWLSFAGAGLIHFFLGWTFLNASQKRVGAARTTSLTGALPLFGMVLAALILGEFPTILAVFGVLLIVSGVYLVNYKRLQQRHPVSREQGLEGGWRSLMPGLLAALCWAISPIFFRYGLAQLPSAILGLTFGILLSVIGYALVLAFRGLTTPINQIPTNYLMTKIIAGLLSALSMWAYWGAIGLAPVGLVLALSLLSVPVVIFLSPLLVGQDLEQVTSHVWLGSGLIVVGSLAAIVFR